MVCESCGEKPKNTAKDFTKAVIEINNPEALVLLRKVVIPTSMGDEESVPPAIGKYRNVLLQYEANDHIYLYSSDGIPTAITANIPQEILDSIAELEATDVVLQQEIDDLKNSPDVVDIVPTYAALQAYDTSKLGDNDIIRVLQDEQHDGQSTYYRWNKQSSTWTYIGAVGDYYTKGQVDTLLTGKQNTLTAGSNITIENNVISATGTTYTAGANVQISPENVISATDTTYTHFTGATSSADGTAGLVPAPTISDPDKFLKGDGTWGTPAGATYTAGTNVQISAQNVISATDTTYSNFVGTDGQTAGTAGLVPAPATTDAGKFLKADGTWDTAGGGGTTEIEYINCTLSGATATGFTLTADKTATQVKALVEAGKEVIYKFVNPTTAGSILAGTYEFSVLFAGTNSSVDVVTGYGMTEVSGTSTQGVYTFNHISSTVTVTAGSIPTVNDATLTIQKNGTTVQTFTANASSNATANIEVPTITMTTTDPGEGSALAADNFVAVYGGDPIIMDYSASEINTGATWIDGSAIYKKTVSIGSLPNATTATTAHSISNFATLIKLEGSFTNGTNSAPIPYASPTTTKCVQAYADATNITIITGEDRSTYSGYITLYYTKSS